ncbi:DUF4333 domain-containing protein [Microbacterium sp. kSW2-24]|uniref:DUF4333 domain-containing protein n=1 Tax=Microbacterium galbinum TaxID=2851646 RepID=UPI001FFD2FBF|nr:DUF4333 domain-containing protein [Microbacterium galbinum]MCK2022636.1 DUF4333 domain-containing protein [Microbacterium galbinum]
MRTSRLAILTAAAGLLATALTGCTFSASATASPDDIATLAEDALEAEIGQRPEIDCGDDSIPLKEDSVVPCLLTDPASGAEFDADVTLTKVDGINVTVSVQVADAPNNAPAPEPSESPATDAGGTLTLTAEEIGVTAARALTDAGVLPSPSVLCPGGSHEVSDGYSLECTAIQGGDQYAATVTISEVEGSSYSVNVVIPELAG